MMENRPKLLINRNVLVSEKSPPPTKLLINHGKPNFTIVKSPKTKSPPTSIEENIFARAELKPSDFKKKSLPKITPINGLSNGTANGSASSAEFLRLHKKIGGRNFDEFENNNNNMNGFHNHVNGNVAFVKDNLVRDENSSAGPKNGFATLKHVETNGFSHHSGSDEDISRTFEKSVTPDRPVTAEKSEISKTVNSNGLTRSPSPLPKQQSSTPSDSMENINSSTNVNFEQRTVVSFSRDLSVTPNRYPDTVKLSKAGDMIDGGMNALPKHFADLKFEIAADGELIRPVKKNAA